MLILHGIRGEAEVILETGFKGDKFKIVNQKFISLEL